MSRHPCFVGHQPGRRGQNFLGAAISVTIVGAILLYYTNAVASHCKAGVKASAGSGACAGLAGAAHQIQGPLSIGVIACVAVFATTFVWSLIR